MTPGQPPVRMSELTLAHLAMREGLVPSVDWDEWASTHIEPIEDET